MTARSRVLIAAVSVFALCCSDRTRAPGPITSGPARDAGQRVDAGFDEPVRALCVPRSLQCLGENSPLYERCIAGGTGFDRAACEDGAVCRDGACVPFSCVPGRPLCVGPLTAAVCDATGRAVEIMAECGAEEACLAGVCTDPCASATEARSYIGCEYVADELPNVHNSFAGVLPSPFGIVVTNPALLLPARVRITSLNGDEPVPLRERYVLEPGPGYGLGEDTELESVLLRSDGTSEPFEVSDVEVPPGSAAVFLPAEGGPYHVRSSRPVAAFQFGPYCCNFTATNDASLLLPRSTWGSRYRVLGYPAWRSGDDSEYLQPYVRLLALEDVEVTVESPVDLRWAEAGTIGQQLSISIPAGGSATLETIVTSSEEPSVAGVDLSGAEITATGPLAAFVGHPCTFVPQDQWACDHLEESLIPADTLGSRYVLSPVRRRSEEFAVRDDSRVTEATYWRLVADEDAVVEFQPTLEEIGARAPSNQGTADCRELLTDGKLVLAAGEVCEFGASEPVTAESTAPLVVGGVISGHQSTGVSNYGSQAGDPSLFLLGPVEQFRTDYSFVNPPTFKRTYVTVTAAPGAPVTLDGRAVPLGQRLERKQVKLGIEEWEVFTLALEPGAHTMASNSKFGIVVYAYDDYVSYAFTGGLDLLPKGSR